MSQAKILRALTEQHPESVAQLFTAYQVGAAPTYNNLLSAYKQHGAPFLDDLNKIFGEFSNYDDSAIAPPPLPAKQPGIVTAIKSIFHQVENNERLRLYENGRLQNRPVIHLSNGATVYADQYVTAMPYTTELQLAQPGQYRDRDSREGKLPDRIFGMSKNLFLVLAGMLTVVIFMEMFQRKH